MTPALLPVFSSSIEFVHCHNIDHEQRVSQHDTLGAAPGLQFKARLSDNRRTTETKCFPYFNPRNIRAIIAHHQPISLPIWTR